MASAGTGHKTNERIHTAPPSEKMFKGSQRCSKPFVPSKSIQQLVTRKDGSARTAIVSASSVRRMNRNETLRTTATAKPSTSASSVEAPATHILLANRDQFMASRTASEST